ncbi:hypothetical protein PSTG_04767 [Puccinia striiformis f. sp. tritici PST-78]|uniref:Uncharacterized protein n=2 Tax=Puccinia striiformis f. sp. tritici TaxID=168172 RepID=A0A0L0VRU3_9BASI|nr:hypothetical protein PSTG_04767 [Puccinia striiformis f. sp. tritici PST-78]
MPRVQGRMHSSRVPCYFKLDGVCCMENPCKDVHRQRLRLQRLRLETASGAGHGIEQKRAGEPSQLGCLPDSGDHRDYSEGCNLKARNVCTIWVSRESTALACWLASKAVDARLGAVTFGKGYDGNAELKAPAEETIVYPRRQCSCGRFLFSKSITTGQSKSHVINYRKTHSKPTRNTPKKRKEGRSEMTVVTESATPMNSLIEQTLSRKEKLNALRKRKLNTNQNGADQSNSNEDQDKAKKREFKFRNYDPIIQGPKRHDPVEHSKETVEETVKDLMEQVKQNDEVIRSSELDLTKIQPKKPNWDLKRDLTKKLSKLEPITQAAFATLIRKRMQAEGATSTDEGTAALVKEMNTDRNPVVEISDDESSDGEN